MVRWTSTGLAAQVIFDARSNQHKGNVPAQDSLDSDCRMVSFCKCVSTFVSSIAYNMVQKQASSSMSEHSISSLHWVKIVVNVNIILHSNAKEWYSKA